MNVKREAGDKNTGFSNQHQNVFEEMAREGRSSNIYILFIYI